MLIGRVIKLVHLSQQTYQPTSRLISGHNDKGYGTIRAVCGRDVYFSHDAVPGRHGFDDLRPGQSVDFTLESDSQSSAKLVTASATPADGRDPTVTNEFCDGIHFRHIVRTYRRPLQTSSITHHALDGYPRGK